MTASNFEACLGEILKHEGGFVDHPRDPGGATNYGISQRSYPKEDIRNMTRARAAAIYRRDYWGAVSGDDLPDGLDLVAFDAAVNSGVSRGAKWLQQALGVRADGRIGAQTIAAAKRADAAAVIHLALGRRLVFMQSLKTWDTFGRGWSRRIDGVQVAALAMASKPAPVIPANPLAAIAALITAILKRILR